MKLIINSIILRLLGAASVDAIMAGFNRTIKKLETLAAHEMAVADALENRADDLRTLAAEAIAKSDETAARAWAAEAKALRLRELIG